MPIKANFQNASNLETCTLSRRRFLRQSAAASAGQLGVPGILRSASPNAILQVACFGVGGMGGNTMKSVASHPKVKIIALHDLDERHGWQVECLG